MLTLALVLVVFAATMLQSLSGFGFALIVMPLATVALGVRTAAPLVALVGLTIYAINLIRFRRAIDLKEVLRLGIASALGIPVGLWLLYGLDEALVKRFLGAILIGYAIYAWLQPAILRAVSRRWAYPAGFLAGLLGGAYNTPGPPVIVYGSLRQWPKEEFRAILQTLFFFNATLVVTSHAIAGRFTSQVLILYLYAVPALVLGILVGSRLDRRLGHERFRILVTAMILILGLALFFGVA